MTALFPWLYSIPADKDKLSKNIRTVQGELVKIVDGDTSGGDCGSDGSDGDGGGDGGATLISMVN